MVSVLASSVIDRGFIGGVMVSVLASSANTVRFFYSASSLKQQSADKYVAPLGHIIPIPRQTLFAFSP
jgi:hypothetical protein